jgi:hypothetical protein
MHMKLLAQILRASHYCCGHEMLILLPKRN